MDFETMGVKRTDFCREWWDDEQVKGGAGGGGGGRTLIPSSPRSRTLWAGKAGRLVVPQRQGGDHKEVEWYGGEGAPLGKGFKGCVYALWNPPSKPHPFNKKGPLKVSCLSPGPAT